MKKKKKINKRVKKPSKIHAYLSKALIVITGAIAGFLIAGPLTAGVGMLAGIAAHHVISK